MPTSFAHATTRSRCVHRRMFARCHRRLGSTCHHWIWTRHHHRIWVHASGEEERRPCATSSARIRAPPLDLGTAIVESVLHHRIRVPRLGSLLHARLITAGFDASTACRRCHIRRHHWSRRHRLQRYSPRRRKLPCRPLSGSPAAACFRISCVLPMSTTADCLQDPPPHAAIGHLIIENHLPAPVRGC